MLDVHGSVEAAELPGRQLVVSAHGPIDARVVRSFTDVLVGATTEGLPVILDLTDAHGLDETALAVIQVAAQLLRERGERLVVVAQPHLAGRLQRSSLSASIDLRRTLREVVSS